MPNAVSDSFGHAFTREHCAIWIISRGVIAVELKSSEFEALPINTQSTLGAVGLCIKANEPLQPVVEIFANFLREEVKRRADILPEHIG